MPTEGLEPSTSTFVAWLSIQLIIRGQNDGFCFLRTAMHSLLRQVGNRGRQLQFHQLVVVFFQWSCSVNRLGLRFPSLSGRNGVQIFENQYFQLHQQSLLSHGANSSASAFVASHLGISITYPLYKLPEGVEPSPHAYQARMHNQYHHRSILNNQLRFFVCSHSHFMNRSHIDLLISISYIILPDNTSSTS